MVGVFRNLGVGDPNINVMLQKLVVSYGISIWLLQTSSNKVLTSSTWIQREEMRTSKSKVSHPETP